MISLNEVINKYKIQLVTIILSSIFVTYISVYLPIIIKDAIKLIDKEFVFEKIQYDFLKLIAMYLLLLIVMSISNYLLGVYRVKTAINIIENLKLKVIDRVMKMNLSKFNNYNTALLNTRITNDTDNIGNLLIQILPDFFSAALTLIFTTIILIKINSIMFLVILSINIILILINKALSTKIARLKKQRVEYNEEERHILLEIFNGIKVIKLFNAENKFLNKIKHYELHKGSVYIDLNETRALINPIIKMFRNIAIAIIIVLFIKNIISLDASLVFIFISYLDKIYDPVFELVNNYNVYIDGKISLKRINLLISNEMDFETLYLGDVIIMEGSIEFKDVCFSYNESENILNNVNFRIKKNEIVGLEGETGSGKTTIVNLILKLYEADSGEILFDNKKVQKIASKSLREQVALSDQTTFIFNDTIRKNISLNNENVTDNEIIEAVNNVGLNYLLDVHGLDTKIKSESLSFGEKQLISFARMIVKDVKIFILDEPTSNLDVNSEELVKSAIKCLREKGTVLIISHKKTTLDFVDRILRIENKKVEVIEKQKKISVLN
ncbi:MAG: ABC transporter ATP-binding protein/permease [Clostridia bacterium]|jgi:ATP-binding cassette subfamily B protein|nr:ABC transporter ATP-binding protein/permease [Clostridia bacterium]